MQARESSTRGSSNRRIDGAQPQPTSSQTPVMQSLGADGHRCISHPTFCPDIRAIAGVSQTHQGRPFPLLHCLPAKPPQAWAADVDCR
eukprot:1158800-Pelagomonas_calceolata.AAC.6